MKHLLEQAGPNTLCLVDEFGSGSDPDLGSALAQVFLKKLHDSGTLGVFTTHYNAIKALAGSLPRATNANMAFDVKTFAPEYRLQVGSPGSSYTFEVAQRVGLPKALLASAREALDGQTRSVDQLLVTLQKQRSALDRTQTESGKRLKELEQLKAEHEGRIAKLEEKLERVGSANAEAADRLAWGRRFESVAKQYAAAKGPKGRQEVLNEVVKLFAERAGRAKKAEKKAETKAQQAQRVRLEQLWALPIKNGDRVRVLSGGRTPGEILEIKKDKYLVRLGNLSSWMDRQQFIPWNEKI
jgi:DNA mismatch repair protein MutS2